jgi:DNA adenine methylase
MLFLNRVNFSGVINGGPIGGLAQSGTYKIDCRFNKDEIIKKIERIALLGNRIKLYNCDASELIATRLQDIIPTSFFNIDPPYVKKGRKLYVRFFREEHHRSLEKIITEHLSETQWIVTYDDCALIRDIYQHYHMTEYGIQYNARSTVQGSEIVITNIPDDSFVWDGTP